MRIDDAMAISTAPRAWRLRIEDGTIFDAPDFETLRNWAAEGRVSPDADVACDGGDWQQAREVDALELQWKVQLLPDNTAFGPLHIGAVLELIADNVIAFDQPIENVRTGQSMTPRQWLQQTVVAAADRDELRERLAVATAAADTASRTLEDDRAVFSERSASLQTDVEELTADRDAAAAERDKLRDQLTRVTAATSEQAGGQEALKAYMAVLQSDVERVTADRDAAVAECDTLRERVAAATAAADAVSRTLDDERSAFIARTASLQTDLESLTADRDTAAAECDTLRERLAAATAAADAASRTLDDERTAFSARSASLQTDVEELTAARDAAVAGCEIIKESLATAESAAAAAAHAWEDERKAFIGHLKEREQKLQAMTSARDALQTSLTAHRAAAQESAQAWKNERTGLTSRAVELQSDARALAAARDQLQTQLAAAESAAVAAQSAWEAERIALSGRLADREQTVQVITAERDALRERLAVGEKALETASRAWEVDRRALTERLTEREKAAQTLTRESDGLRMQIRAQTAVAAEAAQAFESQRTAMEARVAGLRSELDACRADCARLRDSRKNELAELTEERDRLRETLSNMAREGAAAVKPVRKHSTGEGREDIPSKCLPRWWDSPEEDQGRRPVVIEPEVIRESPASVVDDSPAGDDMTAGLQDLERQAQAELAQWQRLQRGAEKIPGGIRQWLGVKKGVR